MASLTPTPSLAKIQDGRAIEGGDRRWIGDPTAYNLFQHNLAELRGLSVAMTKLVDDPTCESVGDLVIYVRSKEEGFRYSMSGMVSTGTIRLGPGTSFDSDDDKDWDTAKEARTSSR